MERMLANVATTRRIPVHGGRSARALLLPLVLLVTLGHGLLGCSSTKEQWEWEWEYFTVDKENLEEERQKLAAVVRDVLLHRRFYTEKGDNLDQVGRDVVLVTHWNEEDARIPQGSYTGTRTRIAVRLAEGMVRHEEYHPDNEADARLLAAARWDDPRDTEMILSLGLASERERNMRMNYIPGEFRKAEWRSDGQDERMVHILRDQIRVRFNEISAREQRQPGDLSDRTRQIYEERDRRSTESGERDEPYGTIGPGTSSEGSGLSFGTNRRTTQ